VLVSHVAEYRFYDLDREAAVAVDRVLTKALLEHGLVFKGDYDSAFRPVANVIKWDPVIPEEGEKPTKSQRSYALSLWKDLREEATRGRDENVVARVQVLLHDVQTTMKDPEATKREASNCIEALSEALADLRFLRTGATYVAR